VVTPDDELVARATQGDAEALRALLERHGLPIRNGLQISSKWNGVVDADDVMQVTYLEAFLRILDFQGRGTEAFRSWLRRIAENNLRDAIRGLERQKRPQNRVANPAGAESYVALVDQLAGTSTTPSRRAAAHEVQEIVESALKDLPPDYERVLRLYELEGRPGREVAVAMERSPGAVKMLLARARDCLREALGSRSRFFSDPA
jgi:RNA polymerase sigma-70 factor (ECF subfamily)